MILKEFDIRIPLQKPEQFVNDRTKMKLLGGQTRESVSQIVADLATKNASGSCPCSIIPIDPISEDVF
jgi:hypothetical protein